MVELIQTQEAPSFEVYDLPISQALVHGGTVYVSGQPGIDPATGNLVEGGAPEEAHQAMRNIAAILEAAGSDLGHLLKVVIYLRDIEDWEAVTEAYREHVSEPYPARTVVSGDLPRDFALEIDAIAAVGEG